MRIGEPDQLFLRHLLNFPRQILPPDTVPINANYPFHVVQDQNVSVVCSQHPTLQQYLTVNAAGQRPRFSRLLGTGPNVVPRLPADLTEKRPLPPGIPARLLRIPSANNLIRVTRIQQLPEYFISGTHVLTKYVC